MAGKAYAAVAPHDVEYASVQVWSAPWWNSGRKQQADPKHPTWHTHSAAGRL